MKKTEQRRMSDYVEVLQDELADIAEMAETGQYSTALYASKLDRAIAILKQLKQRGVGYEITGTFLATAARKAGFLDSAGTGTEGVDLRLGLSQAPQAEVEGSDPSIGDRISSFITGGKSPKG